MKPFPVLLILCGANMAAAQDVDCSDGGTTQLAMNICSYQAYQAADEDLNLAYQLARDTLQASGLIGGSLSQLMSSGINEKLLSAASCQEIFCPG